MLDAYLLLRTTPGPSEPALDLRQCWIPEHVNVVGVGELQEHDAHALQSLPWPEASDLTRARPPAVTLPTVHGSATAAFMRDNFNHEEKADGLPAQSKATFAALQSELVARFKAGRNEPSADSTQGDAAARALLHTKSAHAVFRSVQHYAQQVRATAVGASPLSR